MRTDAPLGLLTCQGSPNNTNAARDNAENIDWSPAVVGPPVERYKCLYSERELRSLANGLEKLDERGGKRAFVIFNNCYQNFGIMNASTMAAMLRGHAQKAR